MPLSESLGRFKAAYTSGGRAVAARLVSRLVRTGVTTNMLSASGVLLCIAGAVIVYFEYLHWWLFHVGSVVFVVGSILDIFDGALARATGGGTEFGAFLDSTLDRVGEGFMLGAIALVLARDGKEWGVALTIAACGGGTTLPPVSTPVDASAPVATPNPESEIAKPTTTPGYVITFGRMR